MNETAVSTDQEHLSPTILLLHKIKSANKKKTKKKQTKNKKNKRKEERHKIKHYLIKSVEHFRAGLTGEVTLKGKISPGQEPYTFTSFTKRQQEGGEHRFSALNLRSATALLFCGSLVTHPSVLFHSVVFPILSFFLFFLLREIVLPDVDTHKVAGWIHARPRQYATLRHMSKKRDR